MELNYVPIIWLAWDCLRGRGGPDGSACFHWFAIGAAVTAPVTALIDIPGRRSF